MSRPCYHCDKREALPRSNFCEECLASSRPLFFPPCERRSSAARKAKTGLLYVAATAAVGWMIYKTVEFVLTP